MGRLKRPRLNESVLRVFDISLGDLSEFHRLSHGSIVEAHVFLAKVSSGRRIGTGVAMPTQPASIYVQRCAMYFLISSHTESAISGRFLVKCGRCLPSEKFGTGSFSPSTTPYILRAIARHLSITSKFQLCVTYRVNIPLEE